MQVVTKKFILQNTEDINSDFIENFIKNNGYNPLRWAIVATNNKEILIESVVINICNKNS